MNFPEKYTNLVARLYSGHQCSNCPIRFKPCDTNSGVNGELSNYAKHLDWHFQHKRANKRKLWFPSLASWVNGPDTITVVEVVRARDDDKCEMCYEKFTVVWNEDQEEWHLWNAVEINEKFYHPSCL